MTNTRGVAIYRNIVAGGLIAAMACFMGVVAYPHNALGALIADQSPCRSLSSPLLQGQQDYLLTVERVGIVNFAATTTDASMKNIWPRIGYTIVVGRVTNRANAIKRADHTDSYIDVLLSWYCTDCSAKDVEGSLPQIGHSYSFRGLTPTALSGLASAAKDRASENIAELMYQLASPIGKARTVDLVVPLFCGVAPAIKSENSGESN